MDELEKKQKRFVNISFDFEKMEKMLDEMMEKVMSSEAKGDKKNPVIMGFAINFSDSGKPQLKEFSNKKAFVEPSLIPIQKEPLMRIDEEQDSITITAELPGVEGRDIKIEPSEQKILLSVCSKDFSYSKEIPLKSPIEPKSMQESLKNGILEVLFKKLK